MFKIQTYFQLYPPQEGNKIMGEEDEYKSAQHFLNENKVNSVGTLSKSEWEVASKFYQYNTVQKLLL